MPGVSLATRTRLTSMLARLLYGCSRCWLSKPAAALLVVAWIAIGVQPPLPDPKVTIALWMSSQIAMLALGFWAMLRRQVQAEEEGAAAGALLSRTGRNPWLPVVAGNLVSTTALRSSCCRKAFFKLLHIGRRVDRELHPLAITGMRKS